MSVVHFVAVTKLARFALALTLIAVPAAAQSSLTGNWTGTYAFSIQISACQNKTFTWSGNASVTLLQTGNALTGRIDLTNFTFINNNCSTTVGEVTRVINGTVDGSTLLLAVPNDSNGWVFNGAVAGDSITAQISDVNGLTGSLNLSRVKGDAPAANVTGNWSGNYNFSDVCPNGAKKSYSGTLTFGLVQSGSNVNGVVTMTNVPLYSQTCTTIANLNMTMSVAGVVSGSTLTAVAFDPTGSFDFPFSATMSGSGMNGTAAGASETSTTGTFTLTQSNSQAPASDFAGRYEGTYNETDNESLSCLNIGSLFFSGSASVMINQAGNSISGAVILEDALDIASNGFGGCIVVNAGEVVLPLYGTLSGNNLTSTLPLRGGVAGLYNVALAADSISGTLVDSIGDAMAFTATRSAAAPTPSVGRFEATPPAIFSGQSAVLSWTTSNATSVSIDNGIGSQAPSGSVTVSPTQTTVYTLTATGPGGSTTAQTTVAVSSGAPRKRPARP